jgi:hypothetical protein
LIHSIADISDIGKRYAKEDPNQGSDKESSGRCHHRSARNDDRRDELRYSNTHQIGGKRRNDYGSNLVANANSAQRDLKFTRHENAGGTRPAGKKFNAVSLLDQPCVYHSREGKAANYKTTDCFVLKEIEKVRRPKGGNGAEPLQKCNADPGFGNDAGCLHTFIGVENQREKKVLVRAVSVNAVAIDIPRYLNWSEQTIT